MIPTLAPYGSATVTDSLSLTLWEESHTVYAMDGAEIATIEGLADLEFYDYAGDVRYDSDDYLYYIDTELGRLYICSDTVFVLVEASAHEPRCYELTNGNFHELFEEYQSSDKK